MVPYVPYRTLILMAVLTPLIVGLTADIPSQDGGATYTVHFDSTGGVPQGWVEVVQEGACVDMDANVSKQGYICIGWALEPDGQPIERLKVTGNTVVYAVWITETDAEGYVQPIEHTEDGIENFTTSLGLVIKYSPYALVIVTFAVCGYVFYTRYQYRGK